MTVSVHVDYIFFFLRGASNLFVTILRCIMHKISILVNHNQVSTMTSNIKF